MTAPRKASRKRVKVESCLHSDSCAEVKRLRRLIVAVTRSVADRRLRHKPGQRFPYWRKTLVFSQAWDRAAAEADRIRRAK